MNDRIIKALAIGLFAVWMAASITVYDAKVAELERRVGELRQQVDSLEKWYEDCQKGVK